MFWRYAVAGAGVYVWLFIRLVVWAWGLRCLIVVGLWWAVGGWLDIALGWFYCWLFSVGFVGVLR